MDFTSRCTRESYLFSIKGASFPFQPTHLLQTHFNRVSDSPGKTSGFLRTQTETQTGKAKIVTDPRRFQPRLSPRPPGTLAKYRWSFACGQGTTTAAARTWQSWDFKPGHMPSTLLLSLSQLRHLGLDATSPSHTAKLVHETFLKFQGRKKWQYGC